MTWMPRALTAPLVAALALLVGCGGADDVAEPDGLPTEPFTLDVEIGACFDRPESPDVEQVHTVDCATPHDFEAYARVDLAGDAFPGADQVAAEALRTCNDEFADYVGVRPGRSGLVVVPVAPSAEQWEAGDRAVTCTVTLREPERLEESVEGSEAPAE